MIDKVALLLPPMQVRSASIGGLPVLFGPSAPFTVSDCFGFDDKIAGTLFVALDCRVLVAGAERFPCNKTSGALA